VNSYVSALAVSGGTLYAGGTFTTAGGKVSAYAAEATIAPPLLLVSHSGNTVTVFWQAVSGWTLHQNSNLANTNGWALNSSWTTSNGTNSLILTSPPGNLFFRLSDP